MISEAVDFLVIFEIEILPNAELLQSNFASNHVFRKPFIVFLDEKFLVFSAAALASLFLLVPASPPFRHVAENSVRTCVQIFDHLDRINKGVALFARKFDGKCHAIPFCCVFCSM